MKTGKRYEQTFHQRGYTEGTQAHERYSISLSIIQMQSKTSLKYPYTTTETVKITNSDNAKRWRGCGETGLPGIAGRKGKWKTH